MTGSTDCVERPWKYFSFSTKHETTETWECGQCGAKTWMPGKQMWQWRWSVPKTPRSVRGGKTEIRCDTCQKETGT